jgi:hypothetical protein
MTQGYSFPEGSYGIALMYDCAGVMSDKVKLPHNFTSYSQARDRGINVQSALRAAGDIGVQAFVVALRNRPRGFPRNGISLGRHFTDAA